MLDLYTLCWVVSLILLSIDIYLTFLTMKLYLPIAYKKLRKKYPHDIAMVLATQETFEIEQNIFVKFILKSLFNHGRYAWLGIAAFASAAITIIYFDLQMFSQNWKDIMILWAGVFIGFQSMTIMTHLWNVRDLKKWSYGKNL